MVRPERFELPTYSSGGCRSIQLSYGRAPSAPSVHAQLCPYQYKEIETRRHALSDNPAPDDSGIRTVRPI